MGMQPQRESRYHESVVKALRKQYSAEKAKPKKRKQFTLASGKVVLEGSPEYRYVLGYAESNYRGFSYPKADRSSRD